MKIINRKRGRTMPKYTNEELLSIIQKQGEQLALFSGEIDALTDRIEVGTNVLAEAYETIDRLRSPNVEEDSDTVEDDIDYINTLFQEATLSCDSYALKDFDTDGSQKVVNIIETVDSVIAGNLVQMDAGKPARLSPQELVTLMHLKQGWTA